MIKRKKVGVALSGGGIRGLAHIGVLKVLEDYNIPIDFISGTSMGAIVGALYSAEPNAKKLEKEVLNEKISNLFDYTISRSGFVKGDKIEKYIQEKLGDIDFKELKTKLFITSYDIKNKREVIFSKGNVAKAVRASISLPGLFIPVKNKNEILVDGGVIDPIPTEILKRAGADIIIAVNVNFIKEKKTKYDENAYKITKSATVMPSILQVFLKSTEIVNSLAAEADLNKSKADLVIDIPIGDVGLLDYSKKKEVIEAGKKYSKKELKHLIRIHKHTILRDFISDVRKSIGIGEGVKIVKKVVKSTLDVPKKIKKAITKS